MIKNESVPADQTVEARRIDVVIGTRAQLIKMAPVMREMEARKVPYRLILTGQHEVTMDDLLWEFRIQSQPESLFDAQEITSIFQMVFWFPRAMIRLLSKRERQPRQNDCRKRIVLVHGDTASTLVAAIAGRLKGLSVGHVEAGLRSFKLFDPFPEELVRILVSRLATLAFAPGDWASSNLNPKRCEIVNTGANTLFDAVRFALEVDIASRQDPATAYCVVSIHRFETLVSKKRLQWIVTEVARLKGVFRVVFVLHPATRRKLKTYGLYEKLSDMKHVELRDRMTYVPFIRLLRDAHFVITDGGSNQEELAYMSKPVLILRKSTERMEGLGTSAELCCFDQNRFRLFVESVNRKCAESTINESEYYPSKVIVDRLIYYSFK